MGQGELGSSLISFSVWDFVVQQLEDRVPALVMEQVNGHRVVPRRVSSWLQAIIKPHTAGFDRQGTCIWN